MSKQKKYWFKRRRYGWGWLPVTWQGWLTVAVFLALSLSAARLLPPKPQQPATSELVSFLAILLGLTVALLAIGYAKGPAPRWRWGKKPSDTPDEDF